MQVLPSVLGLRVCAPLCWYACEIITPNALSCDKLCIIAGLFFWIFYLLTLLRLDKKIVGGPHGRRGAGKGRLLPAGNSSKLMLDASVTVAVVSFNHYLRQLSIKRSIVSSVVKTSECKRVLVWSPLIAMAL